MNRVGILTPIHSDQPGFLEGTIRTLGLNMPIRIEQNFDFGSRDDEPAYIVSTPNQAGEFISIGLGWVEVDYYALAIRDQYIEVELDDPSLPHPLNLRVQQLFEKDEWWVLWDRTFGCPVEERFN